MTPPQIIAHRGASADAAENSLEAFSLAIDVGADMVEFDVRSTKDEELVVFHDKTVEGTPIADLARREIGARVGQDPALLDEVLDLCQGRVGLDVELKEDRHTARVLASVQDRFSTDDVVITSFLDRVVAETKALAPSMRAGLIIGRRYPPAQVSKHLSELFPVSRARACGADVVAMSRHLADFGAICRVSNAGLGAFIWTVNEEPLLRRYLSDRRVEAVITDEPAAALAIRGYSASAGST